MALTRVAIAAVVLVIVSQASAATPAKRLTAKSAGVRATVTWRSGTGPFVKNIRVRIVRKGALRLDQHLPKIYDLPVKLRVRDLDGNGEAEVVADFYTGGAHCCWYSLVYGYARGHYTSFKHEWGDTQYGFSALDRDGLVEFRSYDYRFAYEFTAYAGSAFPVQIWSYRPGKLVDTTRTYGSAVKQDAARLWRAYRADRHSSYPDARGILAAWMADEYLLGRQSTGWGQDARGQRPRRVPGHRRRRHLAEGKPVPDRAAEVFEEARIRPLTEEGPSGVKDEPSPLLPRKTSRPELVPRSAAAGVRSGRNDILRGEREGLALARLRWPTFLRFL